MTSITPDSSSKFGATTSSRSPRDVMDDFFGDAALQGFGAFQDDNDNDNNNTNFDHTNNAFSYLRSNLNQLVDTDIEEDDIIETGYNDEKVGEEEEFYRFLPSVYSDDSSSLTDPFNETNKSSSSKSTIKSTYGQNNPGSGSVPSVADQPALILALVDPPTRRFELLQLNIQGDKARIEHLITSVIRSSAVDPDLGELQYESICDYHGKVITPLTKLIDLPSYHKSKDVPSPPPSMMMFAAADNNNNGSDDDQNQQQQAVDDVIIAAQQSEVLVAVPIGESPIDCTILARHIISHRRVINSLERRGIDTTPMLTLDSYSDDGSSLVSNMTGDGSSSSVMTLSFASHHQQTQEQLNGLSQTVLSYAANLFIFEEQEAGAANNNNNMEANNKKKNSGGSDIIVDTMMLDNYYKNNKENHHGYHNKNNSNNLIIKHHRKSSRHNGWERPICINSNGSRRIWRFEI